MTAKAVFYEGRETFRVGDGELVAPGAGEVRLDVAYCGVCGTDLHIAHGAMDHRVRAPQVIGHEMSGTVAAIGQGVEGFDVGDAVVVRPLDATGEVAADRGHSHISRNLKFLGIDTPGAFQSSWTVPAFTLHRLPAGIDLRLAALTEPLAVACHDVRRADLAAGETAVVLGGGPIGLLIALVARHAGAAVVLTELSPARLELARSLGLDAVDPSSGDVPAHVRRLTDDAGADVVFEVSGSAAAVESMTELAALRGRIVVVAIHPEPRPVKLFDFFWKELELRGARVYEPEDYERAIELLAGGELPLERLITRVEPLERLPDVFRDVGDSVKVLVDCRA
ncbi:MAG TPA: zinc-binding dehydrogenase [Gaiellaceae bacterium]|nr:zinc-binding dehydrogenase [Gaiellaceae bacterium]